MSMTPVLLKQFTQPTLVCLQTVSIAELWTRLSVTTGIERPCERVVVVNESQSPIGVVHLESLIPHLIGSDGQQADRLAETSDRPTDNTDFLSPPTRPTLSAIGMSPDLLHDSYSQTQTTDSIWEQPLSALNPPVLQPIEVIPAELNLTQLGEYLQQQPDHHTQHEWALVDGSGKFVGLLDSKDLLKFLLHNSPVLCAATSPASIATVDPDAAATDRPHSRIAPFVELLEDIPLPMKLQTAKGIVLCHNQAWRSQFPEHQEPDASHQKAEAAHPTRHSSDRSSDNREPDSSIEFNLGLCPMPKGQDRVWQFVKIPLGVALPTPIAEVRALETQPGAEGFNPNLRAPPGQDNDKANPKVDADLSPGNRAIASFESSATPESKDSATEVEEETLWLVLAQDVTDQQQVAKELAAKNADLMQLNRLKDEFLACISHELKTPLTAVLGLSTLLKDPALGKLNDRQARYAQMIYQSGRHLMNVVNDILDLTRIESGQMELILEAVGIEEVCDRAFDQAKQAQNPGDSHHPSAGGEASTGKPETRFTLDIEAGLNTLIADELRLRQMLYNLLSNALKFTTPGSDIGLKVNRWEGWIAFTVWDTGIGIPAQKQHLIFQKFQQLENPMTRQFEGTGLGLVLTQRLARAHGGDVTFVSKESKGSEFTLLLPPCPPQPTTALGEPTATPNRLVLIVEAVPRYIDELNEQLTALGYRVAIARAGTEAVEKARRLQPCAIFLNPLLPMLSGWDVLTLLKSETQTRHIPTIVMGTEVDKERAQMARSDGFVSLPVRASALEKTLHRVTSPPRLQREEQSAPTKLTVLRLSPVEEWTLDDKLSVKNEAMRSPRANAETLTSELNSLLAYGLNTKLNHHYRVLEADDLEQAELLAKVWHLDAILLDTAGRLHNPVAFIEQLSQYPAIAAVPLVTLDRQTTEAAERVPGLTVFPCLKPRRQGRAVSEAYWPDAAALLQAIEMASGISAKATILVVDVSTLPEFALWDRSATFENNTENGDNPLHPTFVNQEWLQALSQYIQTAGFRSLMGRSWSEVWHQLETDNVDLLLICLGDSKWTPVLIEALKSLDRLAEKPSVLVLDRSGEADSQSESNRDRSTLLSRLNGELPKSNIQQENRSPSENGHNSRLKSVLQTMTTHVLPASISMEELLERINHTLRKG